jgi:hypothetical protein
VRILHLASEYPPAKVYGLGRFVHGLARAQAAQGDEVSVLTNSRGGAEDDVLRDGVRVHRIEFPNPPQPPDGQGEVLQFNPSSTTGRSRASSSDRAASATSTWSPATTG